MMTYMHYLGTKDVKIKPEYILMQQVATWGAVRSPTVHHASSSMSHIYRHF